MKKQITNDEDVIGIVTNMPVLGISGLRRICDYCARNTDSKNEMILKIASLSFLFGYGRGKHDERKRLNRTANTEKPKA